MQGRSPLPVRGGADEARGACPEAVVLPEQSQERAACIGQAVRFPILAEVCLAVFWSDETLSPCFPPPTPSKTLQIRLKCLPFLSTPFA